MGTVDYVIIGVVAAVLGLIVWYVVSSRKKGRKCIGCPDSGSCCSSKCSGNCSGCQMK